MRGFLKNVSSKRLTGHYEFVENAGLNISGFTAPYDRATLNIESYFKDSATKERIKKLPLREQQAICELIVVRQVF